MTDYIKGMAKKELESVQARIEWTQEDIERATRSLAHYQTYWEELKAQEAALKEFLNE